MQELKDEQLPGTTAFEDPVIDLGEMYDDADIEADELQEHMSGQHMVSQLRSMMGQLTTVATPILMEVAVKAAELAAAAAKAAGPVAHRVADVTETVADRAALASEHLAADLRASKAAHADRPAAAESILEPATEGPEVAGAVKAS